MYCQRCGTQLDDSAQFCCACGVGLANATFPGAAIAASVRVLGILWAIYSGFRILMAVWTLVFSRMVLPMFANFIPHEAAPFPFIPFLRAIYLWSAVYGVVAGLVGIWAAWSLLQKEPQGRILALVIAFISLLSIPLGTGLAVYTLVVLLPESAGNAYKRISTTS